MFKDIQYGHGTHCAGTIAGKRSNDGINEVTGIADGIAPGAKLAFIDCGDSRELATVYILINKTRFLKLLTFVFNFFFYTKNFFSVEGELNIPPTKLLLDTGRKNSQDPITRIHSISWGFAGNHYSSKSSQFDEYMHANDDILLVVAAGNRGQKETRNANVSNPATAKNVISGKYTIYITLV